MSALRRLAVTSFAVALVAGLAVAAPVGGSVAGPSTSTVVAIGPGCCK